MNNLTLEEIKENFQLFENQLDKFEYLIELGKNNVGLDSYNKIEKNLIIGCASRSWVICNKENQSFYIDGKKVLTKVGLGNTITSQRMNGFLSALDKVKEIVKYYD